ncbi:unannotated protein [freshwater metagenome]|uniref:Unannotated protein n=1 Tax=freshwater metagenome TaxID=449393 RepID=A0A6J7MC45_9ZZZZ
MTATPWGGVISPSVRLSISAKANESPADGPPMAAVSKSTANGRSTVLVSRAVNPIKVRVSSSGLATNSTSTSWLFVPPSEVSDKIVSVAISPGAALANAVVNFETTSMTIGPSPTSIDSMTSPTCKTLHARFFGLSVGHSVGSKPATCAGPSVKVASKPK